MGGRFPRVFSPFRIGSLELSNRIFVPAHTTTYGDDHLPSERHVHYHGEKARGGVGLIIFDAIRVHPTSIDRAQGVIGYDPRCVPRFRRRRRHGAASCTTSRATITASEAAAMGRVMNIAKLPPESERD
jgi:2,4-dienoyl-CoA reductase-like NADH-dependent reductase (Old Yellow Enzyme family)